MPLFVGVIFLALAAITSRAAEPSGAPAAGAPAVLQIDGLGKGTAPLDGPWQFHLGDDPSFAQPQTADSTGVNGWEQLSPDKTWGAQGHPAYTGYAWYRKHIHIAPAPGASPDISLFIRRIDNAYEIYWNGQLVGQSGKLPPNPSYPYNPPPQTFGLGPVRDGVLVFRVWKAPLQSFDSEQLGGFNFAPIVGSPEAIAAHKTRIRLLMAAQPPISTSAFNPFIALSWCSACSPGSATALRKFCSGSLSSPDFR